MDKYWKAIILVALLAALALAAVAYGQSESCHIRLPPGDGTVRDNWVEGCDSANQTGSYARFYTFAQGGETRVTITLESETVDTYLNLLEGSSQEGTILFHNDDLAGNTRKSEISEILPPGTYTIEATTYNSGATGSFILNISGLPNETLPTPTPTPGPAVLTTGLNEVCLMDEGGQIRCQEVDTDGRTGPPMGDKFLALASGDTHACGLDIDGKIICWSSIEATRKGNWTEIKRDDGNSYHTMGSSKTARSTTPWSLGIQCNALGYPLIVVDRVGIAIYRDSATAPRTRPINVEIDGNSRNQTWFYVPVSTAGLVATDYFSNATYANYLVQHMLDSELLTFHVPYANGADAIEFPVSGLGEYISDTEDLGCGTTRTTGSVDATEEMHLKDIQPHEYAGQ